MEIVNGYVCRNCTDVEYAKKGVDPARPKDGPAGVARAVEAERVQRAAEVKSGRGPSVAFGGGLAGDPSPLGLPPPPAYMPGSTVDISA